MPGLHVCNTFLNTEEVEALRLVFAAHQGWLLYHWGELGRAGGAQSGLASTLKRIDFGEEEMTAEGVAASRSAVQPLGALQLELIAMFETRLRAAFRPLLWADSPCANMLQFTQISAGHCLGHHFDRRDKWSEGIASIAWSDVASAADPRGEHWTLSMQCGVAPGAPVRPALWSHCPAIHRPSPTVSDILIFSSSLDSHRRHQG